MTKAKQLNAIIKEMLKNGKPERLPIRFNKLAVVQGYAIENSMGLAIGDTFETLEAAHKIHSKAWFRAWEKFENKA